MLSIKQAREPATGGQSSQGVELLSQALDSLDVSDEERIKKPEAAEHIETLYLFCDNEERTVKISSVLAIEEKNMLVWCLKVNSDVFAWLAVDMLGVDLQVIFNKLNVLLEAKLVKQKKRKFTLQVVEAVR